MNNIIGGGADMDTGGKMPTDKKRTPEISGGRKRLKRIMCRGAAFVFFAVFLSACGIRPGRFPERTDTVDETRKEASAAGQVSEEGPAFGENPILNTENAENENMAGLLQRSAAGAMVRLETEGTIGSGVIYAMDGKRMELVTAGHVLEKAKSVKIVFSDGFELECKDFLISENADVGFLRVDMRLVPEENAGRYCYAATDKASADLLSAGDGIIVTGSIDGAAGNAYEGELIDPWIYVEDFSQYMMWGRTYVKAGMSGGGVFDLQGRLIGILCGASGDNEVAVLPLSIIRTEYEQISGVVQNTSATAQESLVTSGELFAQAESLNALVEQFELAEKK